MLNIFKVIPCLENGQINIWKKFKVSTVIFESHQKTKQIWLKSGFV